MMENRFPIFRMLIDGRHFYRIDNAENFTEIQIVGNRRTVHRIEAKAYPEKVRVQQMIDMSDGLYAEIDAFRWEEEWEATGL
jgi:thiamine monophosphate kinase